MGYLKDKIDQIINPRIEASVNEAITKASDWEKAFTNGESMDGFLYQGTNVKDAFKQVPSVFKAVKAITDNISQAEVRFYNKNDLEGEPIPPEKLNKDIIRLFGKPNSTMNFKELLQYCAGFLVLYGELIIIKVESSGQAAGTTTAPAELLIDSPIFFKAVRENGVSKGKVLKWVYNKTGASYDSDSVIFLREFNNTDVERGLSPNVPLKTLLDTDYSSRVYNKKFFDNDATPSAAFESDKALNDKQRSRIKEFIKTQFQGLKNAFRFIVLEQGLKIKPITSSHKDMKFIEQTKYTREEIIGTYRVPKALFGITEDINYATFIGQMKIFWIYTLAPILRRIEFGFNADLMPQLDSNVIMRFDFSNTPAFKEDFQDKVKVASELFKMGFPINQINKRLQLGMEDVAWGDDWYIPFSQVPAGSVPVVDEPAKSVKKGIDPKRAEQLFMANHNKIEKRFASALGKYFFEQRQLVLSEISDKSIKAVGNIDWVEEDAKLVKVSSPYIFESVEAGAGLAKLLTEISINDEIMAQKLNVLTSQRAELITRINETVRNNLNAEINAGIAGGETTQQISDRVRSVYTTTGNRAKLIARTEVTAAMNLSSSEYYQQAGVRKKQWVTAGDERVRATHAAINLEIVPITADFSNGVTVPGSGGSAAETINCRCTIVPVIE